MGEDEMKKLEQTTIAIYRDDLKRIHSHKQFRPRSKKHQQYYETVSEVIDRAINVFEREEKDK